MTADGGATWTVRQSTTEMKLRSVRFINSSEIIACGDAGVIVRSEDAGDNWEVVNSNTGANLRDIHFIDDNIGFAAGESSTFLTSIDGGRTWSTPSAGSDNYSSVYMRTLMIGTVVGEDDLLLMTIDGGNTWTPFELTAAVNNSYNSVTYADASVGVAVGNGGLIARTEDGAAWTLITSPTTENLYSVEFSDGTHGVCVGSNDIRLYSDDAGVTWTIGNNNAIHPKVYNPGLMPNDFSLSQNYPNPFNPSTKINYQLPSDSKVTLQVFDMSGREVRSLVNSFQTAGTYSITFDANGLASGIYFYRLAAGNFVKTMKMSLVK